MSGRSPNLLRLAIVALTILFTVSMNLTNNVVHAGEGRDEEAQQQRIHSDTTVSNPSVSVGINHTLHIAFLGDSITYGQRPKVRHLGPVREPFPARAISLLNKEASSLACEVHHTVHAFIGATLPSFLESQQWRDFFGQKSRRYDIVVVCLGVNDMISRGTSWTEEYNRTFHNALQQLRSTLRQRATMVLFIEPLRMPPLRVQDTPEELLKVLDRLVLGPLRDVARKERWDVLRVGSASFYPFGPYCMTDPTYFYDGVHPTKEGHRALGNFVAQRLTRVVAKLCQGASRKDLTFVKVPHTRDLKVCPSGLLDLALKMF